jgi:hypothetical protein
VIAATGETTLASTTGNIALTGTNNDFGVVNASAKDIALVDKNALAVTLTATGSSTLTAGADLVVSGSSGSLQASAGQSLAVGSITTVAGDVQLEAVKDISLGELNVQGKLAATTTTGNITQTGPLSVAGASDLNAPVGQIDLGNTANKFGALVSFKSPNTVFAGVGAPTNALEQAIISSVLSQAMPKATQPPSFQSQFSSVNTEPVASEPSSPTTPTTASTQTGASDGVPQSTVPSAYFPTVGGIQVVEVSSAQLALIQPSTSPNVSNNTGSGGNADIGASEPKDSKTQDTALRQMIDTTTNTPGRVSLFVIDGGIRLPLAAQEERAPQSANANSPALKRPQDREDSLQQKDQ